MFPLFLRLDGKEVLVVGGGNVAERKILELEAAGAAVRVVSPDLTPALEELGATGRIAIERRRFEDTDADSAWLVIAATNRPEIQARVCAIADRARVFSIAIDDPPNGSAYSASVLRRGPFTVAISSSGEAPALSRLLREVLEDALPDADWVESARALRDKWKAEKTPMGSRFADLVRVFKEKAKDG